MTPLTNYIIDACLLSATTLVAMATAKWRQLAILRGNQICALSETLEVRDASIDYQSDLIGKKNAFIAEQAESIQSLDGEATSYSIMLTAQQDHLERLEAAYKAAVPERMGNGRFAKKAAS